MKTRSWRFPVVLGVGALLGTGACLNPRLETQAPAAGWESGYADALSPRAQLALGLLEVLKETPEQLPRREAVAQRWAELARLVREGAEEEKLDSARQAVERELDAARLARLQARRYGRGDLVSFMMGSGVKPPSGGQGSVDPERIVVAHLDGVLAGTVRADSASRPIELVAPDLALSPSELLALGTASLLAEEPGSLEMPQIFRLALYFRPLRRLYDPKISQSFDARMEAVYLDRIWRVLTPEQVAWIRRKAFTREDLRSYLEKHDPLHQVDIQSHPSFALLEFTVNDFHEQIAPKEQVVREGSFYIPESLLANPEGKTLYESICAACHGLDGQGRFPPIGVKSYLALHSDNEHFEIVKAGPPQKKGSPVVMPAFGKAGLSDAQIWSIVRYLRTFEERAETRPRGEEEASAAGVRFYSAEEVHARWASKSQEVLVLDVQSDIAYRIMGHIPGSVHIAPEELEARMEELPRDKELILVDMFGSQGIQPATRLASAGFRVGYLRAGMSDWHITRNYPVLHSAK